MSAEERRRTSATRSRRAAAGLVLLAPVVALVATLLPEDGHAAWLLAAVAIAASLLVLARAPRRGRAGPAWGMIGLGLLIWSGGIVAAAQSFGDDAASAAVPNATDAPRMVGLLVIAAALVTMAVARSERLDRIATIDALIVAVGAAAVVITVGSVALAERDLSDAGVAVTWGALAVAVLLAAAVVRLGLTDLSRAPSARFVVAGAALVGVGAGFVRAGQLDLSEIELVRTGTAVAAVGCLVLAAAAVHPSAVRVADRDIVPAHALPRARLGLLVIACTAAPVIAMVQHLRDAEVDGLLLGGTTVAVMVLLAARLQLVVRSGQVQADQAVALRDAALKVGAARDVAAIRAAALDAAVELSGGSVRYVAWLVANDRGTMSPLEVRSQRGPVAREDTDLDAVLAHVVDLGERPLRLTDSEGNEVIVAPIASRQTAPAALALAPAGRPPGELGEGLAILATQCTLAMDALLQTQELHQRRSEARVQQLVRNSIDAVFIVGADGRVRYQTPSVVRVLGYLAVDLDGAPLRRIAHSDDASHVERFLDNLVTLPHESSRSMEAQLLRADDSVIHAEIVGVNLLDNLDVRGIVLTVRDVSGRRTLEDQLRHQAFHDSLTGLANRALFTDRVEHALNRVRREDAITPSVLFLDLDDFKMVNDSMGHGAGDQLLVVLGERLRTCLRSGDTAARLGGDEFAVLLEDAPDLDAVREVAERILDALSEPVTVEDRSLHVRASIGVATRLVPTMSPEELLRNADLAMYAAKSQGKGCIEVFEPSMHRRAVDRMAIRADLERSVEQGDIDLVYQPVVRMSDGEIVAFEALARWNHPERGPVAPEQFLPVAEDTGVVVALGRLVLDQAARRVTAWRAASPQSGWSVCVNLSTREVLAPDLVDRVKATLSETGLDPVALTLELTETGLLRDADQVLNRLSLVKELGVQIAIDNFGTGYSSLSYLQRVPFDIVKIDRTLVSALRTQDPARTVARTVIDLAHTLGRVVVAQGVEQQIEIDGLLQLGCQLGQGFLLHRPVDAATMATQLGLYPATA